MSLLHLMSASLVCVILREWFFEVFNSTFAYVNILSLGGGGRARLVLLSPLFSAAHFWFCARGIRTRLYRSDFYIVCDACVFKFPRGVWWFASDYEAFRQAKETSVGAEVIAVRNEVAQREKVNFTTIRLALFFTILMEGDSRVLSTCGQCVAPTPININKKKMGEYYKFVVFILYVNY